jgi:hypothetical protein
VSGNTRFRCSWQNRKGWRSLSAGYSHYLNGKFLFFARRWESLAHLAEEEILSHGFPLATIPVKPKSESYVLCLFDVDESRQAELQARYDDDYDDDDVVFRGWKPSEGLTWQGGNLTAEQFREAQEAARRARPRLAPRGLQKGGQSWWLHIPQEHLQGGTYPSIRLPRCPNSVRPGCGPGVGRSTQHHPGGLLTSPFEFKAPEWANNQTSPETAEQALRRSGEVVSSYYALGAQTGVHAMIEWCGVMSEYVRMLEHAWTTQEIDPRDLNEHGGAVAGLPSYMIAYFCEKLGCQIKPFIRSNTSAWRREINKWFEQ